MSFDKLNTVPDAATPHADAQQPLDEQSTAEETAGEPTTGITPDDSEIDDSEIDDDDADDGFETDAADDAESDAATIDGGAAAVLYDEQVEPQYGILGFTLRELIIVGAWLVAFIVSFFPLTPVLPATIWTSGIGWVLTIGVPTVAVFLIVLRRLSPEGIRRVGSLGIDQFASVASSAAAVAWVQLLWSQSAASIRTGSFVVGWPVMVALAAVLVLVAVTVAARVFPPLREDFTGRRETLAHSSANPVRPVISRPRPAAAPAAVDAADTAAAPSEHADAALPVDAEPDAEERPYDPDETHVIPRLDLSMLPGAAAAPGAADSESAPESELAPESEPESEPTTVPDSGEPAIIDTTPARAAADLDDSAPVEVYKTGAVDVLREIFAADGVTSPIAMLSTDTGTIRSEPAGGDEPAANSEPAGNSEPGEGGESSEGGENAASAEDDDQPEKPVLRRDRIAQTRQRQDQEPFWILAQTERDVLDELGRPLFRIGPNDWTLVLEDRGGAFVVRHEDGRIGYLHDMSDITKG